MKNLLRHRIAVLSLLCALTVVMTSAQTARRARHTAPPQDRMAVPALSAEQRSALLGVTSVNLPWFDDVESGPGEWAPAGFWHRVFQPQKISVLNPTIFPNLVLYPDSGRLPGAYSGSYAWWFGEDVTGTFIGSNFDRLQPLLSGGTSLDTIGGSLLTPLINLVGQKNALLTFQTWWEVEGVETDFYDLMRVQVSADTGKTWFPLGRGLLNPINDPSGEAWKSFSSGGLGQRGIWTQQLFDLTSYVGKTVVVRFYFSTGDDLFNGFRGWFIDNISVTGSALPKPAFASVSPSVINPAAQTGSTIVTVHGANFVSGAFLAIDSTLVGTAAVMSSSEMTFVADLSLSVGVHSLTIQNPDGQKVVASNVLRVTTSLPPVLSSIQPDSGFAGTTVPVRITGSNIKPGAYVQVGSVPLTGVTWIDATSLTGILPPRLPVGVYNVQLVNPDTLSDQLILAFRVIDQPVSVTSIQPDTAEVGVSIYTQIKGDHFKPGAVVDFIGFNLQGDPVHHFLAPGAEFVDSTFISVQTPATLPAGIYDVRVINPDGYNGTLKQAFWVVVRVIGVSPVGVPTAGEPITLKVIPPVGQPYDSGVLAFKRGGTTLYDTIQLKKDSLGGGFTGFFPDSVMTIRGVDYWIELLSANGILRYPAFYASAAVFPVRVALLPTKAALSPREYHMVSTPVDLDAPFIEPQLAPDYGPYDPTKWRVFRWDGNDNVEFLSIQKRLAPGNAFWLITDDGQPFSFRAGTSVNTSSFYYMTLDTGWSQIATPFAFRQQWAGIYQYTGGVTGPYSFDGSQYRLESVLAPFEGYFVHNDSPYPVQIAFPPADSANQAIGKRSVTAGLLAAGEFVLRVAAEIPGTNYRDTYNFLGIRSAASVGRDRLDAPKPPPIGTGLRVNIVDEGKPYLQNFKPAGKAGQSWIVSVTAAGVKGRARVSLTPNGSLPPGYGLHVLDLVDENVVPVTSGSFGVELTTPGAPRYFKVIMGTDAYAEGESKGIPLEPVAFALEQNFPNPFNPSTVIRYGLAKKSGVTLEIYNTIGQKVRTLVDDVQTTGLYEIVWNGTNQSGGHVASGVYFYRLRTESYTAVRKLILLR